MEELEERIHARRHRRRWAAASLGAVVLAAGVLTVAAWPRDSSRPVAVGTTSDVPDPCRIGAEPPFAATWVPPGLDPVLQRGSGESWQIVRRPDGSTEQVPPDDEATFTWYGERDRYVDVRRGGAGQAPALGTWEQIKVLGRDASFGAIEDGYMVEFQLGSLTCETFGLLGYGVTADELKGVAQSLVAADVRDGIYWIGDCPSARQPLRPVTVEDKPSQGLADALPPAGATRPQTVRTIADSDANEILTAFDGAVDVRAAPRRGLMYSVTRDGDQQFEVASDDHLVVTLDSAEHCVDDPSFWSGIPIHFALTPPRDAGLLLEQAMVDAVIATPDGVLRVGADGSATQVLPRSVSAAFDDGLGGLVFQTIAWSPAEPQNTDNSIWWLRPREARPIEVIPATDRRGVTLHDVVEIDGAATVVYTVHEGGFVGPDDAVEAVQLLDLATREVTEIDRYNGFEASSRAEIGGDLVAREWNVEASGWTSLETLAGDPVEVPGLTDGRAAGWAANNPCVDTVECPTGVALSPDGSQLAYALPLRNGDGSYDRQEIVVVETATGDTLHRITLPIEGEATLDLGSSNLVVNRESYAALVIDLDTEEFTALPRQGTARLAL